MNITKEYGENVIYIDNIPYEILHKFDVLHAGWELDYTAYIIHFAGLKRLIWSDHGGLFFVENEKSTDIMQLLDWIYNYTIVINETSKALKLLVKE